MPVPEKIRVMIVDDIPETRENIRRLLSFDKNIDVIADASGGKEAIDLTKKLFPDVVIMDINMPDIDGIMATEIIRQKSPFTQVVILSVQNDPAHMRGAMLAGARDFLEKPPTIDDLIAAIHRAGAMASEEKAKHELSLSASSTSPGGSGHILNEKAGKIITVYSPKGGTGNTTIATNLALIFQTHAKTILVDGNLQFGDVAIFLNEQIKYSILDLTQRVDELDKDIVEDVTIVNSVSGLSLLASSPILDITTHVTGEQFSKLLQFLKRFYAYIIIDTPSILSEHVAGAMDVSDIIILVTTQDIPSIKNANTFLNFCDSVGIKRERVLFVMNQFDKRISISPEKVSENLHQEIVAIIPFDERVVSTSINKGYPLFLEIKTHPVTRSIVQLTDQVQNRITALDEEMELIPKKYK